MKKIIPFIIVLLLIMPLSANAQTAYDETSEIIDGDILKEKLPDGVGSRLDELGIEPENPDWAENIGIIKILSHIFGFIKSGALGPLTAGGGILAVILVGGLFSGTEITPSGNILEYVLTVCCTAMTVKPILAVVETAVNALRDTAEFMTVFIPVFASVLSASGKTLTSASMSALLLTAAQAVEMISAEIVIPLICGYISLSIASGISPVLSNASIAETVKKISFWIMAFITTVFIGILSIQTAVNASADTVALRMAKFVIGSGVPVAGTVLSEALTTVTASLGLLKTTVGIYGVIVCCAIFLPIFTELILWRAMLNLTAMTAGMFSREKTRILLLSIDTALSVLCGIILITAAMFIISLTAIVTVGKS